MLQSERNYIQADNKDLFSIFLLGNNINYGKVSVLDFGCNQGNYVNHAKFVVSPDRYLGVDIIENSITLARKKYPNYEFLHYNGWHPSFNPEGDKNLVLTDTLNRGFDVIIAYSVFTHNTVEETQKQIAVLKELLNPHGCILMTFWHLEKFDRSVEYISSMTNNLSYDEAALKSCKKVAYWIDFNNTVVDQMNYNIDSCDSLFTYYEPSEMGNFFPGIELIGELPEPTQWLYGIRT
jgi:SAM-dependent methyltransferase